MKILFFITKSEQGGAQTHVAQLTRWLIDHGHDVAIMSAPEGWLQDEADRLTAQFFPNKELANTTNLIRLWKASRRFLEAVDGFKPDLVTCHSTMAGLVGRLSLRDRIPTIFTAHGWGFQPGAPRLRRFLLPHLERLAGQFSKKIICVSRNDLKLAHKRHIATDDKLTLVYNGVETPDNGMIASSTVGRPPRNDEAINILFVGRLAAPKNPSLLVEAFARLPREIQKKARITIVGDGPNRTQLESLIDHHQLANQIELTGALPREEVLDRLQTKTDLFVLLSHWEGFPYSILEAMAAGVPIIASRVGGIPEALEHGGGILIDHDSLEQLVESLTMLINDAQKRLVLGAAARNNALSHFSVEKMCENTFAEYQRALLQ